MSNVKLCRAARTLMFREGDERTSAVSTMGSDDSCCGNEGARSQNGWREVGGGGS